MRKVTGYIGALIVVVALMGSILAGYALNINGQSVVVNEYENVTDVSGLYSHTDQKTYIDYNPASNYTGYDAATFLSDSPESNNKYYYREIKNDIELTITTDGSVTVNGHTYPSGSARCVSLICDKFYINHSGSGFFLSSYDLPRQYFTTDITITISGNTITVNDNNGFNDYWGNITKILRLSDSTDYDYYFIDVNQVPTPKYGYYSDKNDIVTFSNMTPKYGGTTSSVGFISVGETYYTIYNVNDWTGFYDGHQIPINGWMFTESAIPGTDLYRFDANFRSSSSDGWDSTGTTKTITEVFVFYPAYKTTNNGWVGINYTESNRVNNYPLPRVDGTTTTTETINISELSGLTNYSRVSDFYTSYGTPIIGYSDSNGTLTNPNTGDIYQIENIAYRAPMAYQISGGGANTLEYVNYKLSDILTAGATIPAGTTQVLIDLSSNNSVTYYAFGVSETFDMNQPSFNNNTYISDTYTSNNRQVLDGINNKFGSKTYGIYYPGTGLVDCYDSNGVKLSTQSADSIYIGSSKIPSSLSMETNYPYLIVNGYRSNISPAWMEQQCYYGATTNLYTADASNNNYTTNINLTYYVDTSSQKYIDITKGFAINPSDSVDVTWNNEYENGTIDILFRAENPNTNYSNTISLSGNEIYINYTGGRFYISLNGAAQVDIGTWRNIVLQIDLINGDVSVRPVRTFNSYTNVVLDNASIDVGEMQNPEPTNTITWNHTNNSFRFNIYATSVFLNTYNVVMVNPSLNIMDYFPDLAQFYRLDLDNFSIYGDSMTVNGVTGEVNGNTITFDESTFIIDDLKITYADGHAYMEDSHISLDLGEITDTNISLSGIWYFETVLQRGYTAQKQIYTWDWQDFILDNTQFCIFYIGLALVGLVVARRFCIMSVIDYAVFITSIIIALSTQVIA